MWFQGTIVNAIEKSKTENKLFLVFIQGNNENSQKMVQVLDNLKQPLLDLIEKELVCVRLMEGTSNCTFFSQMYPVVMIPSTYIIGHKGLLLEVIAGSVSEEIFQEKIEKAMNINKAEIAKTGLNQVKNEESDSIKSASSSQSNTVLDSSDNQASTSSSNYQDFNNKLERAKGLIEEIKVKKAKEEDEKLRKQEEERIRMGKELAQAKIKKQEMELQELIKERERDKKEEKLARERVLAQIAADREERRKRNETNNLAGQSCQWRPRKIAKQDQTASVSSSTSNEAKIQFRFSDGSSITHIFSADDHLRKLYHFVTDNSDYRNFDLSTTFPKRVFTSTQMSQNLRELGLVPNSVLLVILSSFPATSLQSIAPVNVFTNTLSHIYSPFAYLWSLILHYSTSIIAAISPNSDPVTSEQANPSTVSRQNRLNRKAKESKYLNKDGNIARLHDNRFEDDDDENTWNGNSTQQM